MSVIKVDSKNFESEVLKSDKPVVVDFSAIWCGPCQMMKPIFEKVASENSDIKYCSCDIDANSDLAKRYSVMYVPTIIAFNNGEIANTKVGLISEDELKSMI
ncbi:MAG: thioredoxin [Lachnospirales bacterium]